VPPPLILASTSAARRTQLERLGLTVECIAPPVDESAWKTKRWPVRTVARRLAEAKAKAVSERRPDAVVIGGDQIASLDGEPFDKPGSFEVARNHLRRLAGRQHELATGVALAHPGGFLSHVEIVELTMRPLTDAEIEAYLAADEPFECAGCYRWERRGPMLFNSICTNDPSAILGLPLLWLTAALRNLGYPMP